MTAKLDNKGFVAKYEADTKKLLDELDKRHKEVLGSHAKEVKELRALLPDKQREFEKLAQKILSAEEGEAEQLKKELQSATEKLITVATSLLNAMERDQELNPPA